MHKAILGLCPILFFAIATAAADEDAIAKDQPKLDVLLSLESAALEPEKKLFFGFIEFDWHPNAPGGVPGFGPLPAAAAKVAVVKTEQVDATRRPNRHEK